MFDYFCCILQQERKDPERYSRIIAMSQQKSFLSNECMKYATEVELREGRQLINVEHNPKNVVGAIFSPPGRSPGRATVLPLALALGAASALAKCLSFYVNVFYVKGKALSGELSCPCDRSALGLAAASGLAKCLTLKFFHVMGKALSGELSCPFDRSCFFDTKAGRSVEMWKHYRHRSDCF